MVTLGHPKCRTIGISEEVRLGPAPGLQIEIIVHAIDINLIN